MFFLATFKINLRVDFSQQQICRMTSQPRWPPIHCLKTISGFYLLSGTAVWLKNNLFFGTFFSLFPNCGKGERTGKTMVVF